MLKVNDRFTIDKDKHNMILVEYYEGKDRETKQPKRMSRETYHMTMLQVCEVIIDRSVEGKTVEDVVDSINAARRDIVEALKGVSGGMDKG